jgi:predicted amidophosphoribosyltransferase
MKEIIGREIGGGAIPVKRATVIIEDGRNGGGLRHDAGLCRDCAHGTSDFMTLIVHAQALFRPVLDYALPPRCPACGVIVSDPLAFCADCWLSIDFIGEPICDICGLELPGEAIGYEAQCGACLAEAPPFERARAVMRHGDVGRTIAHRLKYGRHVSLARVMATHMARLLPLELDDQAIIVPVPLHSLGRRERRNVVKSAFAVPPAGKAKIAGKTIILIDDIWTTGATATACAKLLKRAGASRVEILCWTRVSVGGD